MPGGVIIGKKATGDVHFLSPDGSREVFPRALGVNVKLGKEFGGLEIDDAVEEAKRFAIGALQQKMAYKTRGKDCQVIVKNLRVDYTVKYGFEGKAVAPGRRRLPRGYTGP
jgi:hypothetical protein